MICKIPNMSKLIQQVEQNSRRRSLTDRIFSETQNLWASSQHSNMEITLNDPNSLIHNSKTNRTDNFLLIARQSNGQVESSSRVVMDHFRMVVDVNNRTGEATIERKPFLLSKKKVLEILDRYLGILQGLSVKQENFNSVNLGSIYNGRVAHFATTKNGKVNGFDFSILSTIDAK